MAFQPMTNPKHMLYALIFCNGYYCAFRGGEDHHSLKMMDVTEGTFIIEHGEELDGLPYMKVNIPASMVTILSVTHPSCQAESKNSLDCSF
jgi:hypothetical protein